MGSGSPENDSRPLSLDSTKKFLAGCLRTAAARLPQSASAKRSRIPENSGRWRAWRLSHERPNSRELGYFRQRCATSKIPVGPVESRFGSMLRQLVAGRREILERLELSRKEPVTVSSSKNGRRESGSEIGKVMAVVMSLMTAVRKKSEKAGRSVQWSLVSGQWSVVTVLCALCVLCGTRRDLDRSLSYGFHQGVSVHYVLLFWIAKGIC